MDIPPPLIHEQFVQFGEFIALGLVLAAAYDYYRAFRLHSGIRSMTALVVIDFLFWLAATVLCLWRLFAYHWGIVSVHTFVCLIAGGLLYFALFSRFLSPLWRKKFGWVFGMLRRLRRFSGRVRRAAAHPFNCLCRWGEVQLSRINLAVRPVVSRILSFRRRS